MPDGGFLLEGTATDDVTSERAAWLVWTDAAGATGPVAEQRR